MFALGSIVDFIKTPLFKYIAIALVALLVVWRIYAAGEAHVQSEWDADKVKVQEVIDDLKVKAGAVTTVVETKYVTREVEVKVKGDTITKYVDRYITSDEDKACIIPNNFILIHDAAAMNQIINEDTK